MNATKSKSQKNVKMLQCDIWYRKQRFVASRWEFSWEVVAPVGELDLVVLPLNDPLH